MNNTFAKPVPRRIVEAASESDRLILSNMRLATHVAARYSCRMGGRDFEDLQGEAMLALCQAARSFKPELGAPFAPWALRYITTALNRMVHRAGRLETVSLEGLEGYRL